MPYLAAAADPTYPECVLTQFHGEEIRLSWFMVRCGDMKYVVYGSGKEVPARLFNITRDGDELNDLYSTSYHTALYDRTPGDLSQHDLRTARTARVTTATHRGQYQVSRHAS
jgi:hypothetical protein